MEDRRSASFKGRGTDRSTIRVSVTAGAADVSLASSDVPGGRRHLQGPLEGPLSAPEATVRITGGPCARRR